MIARALAGALLAGSLAVAPVTASIVLPTPPPPVIADPRPPIEPENDALITVLLLGGAAGALGAGVVIGTIRRRR